MSGTSIYVERRNRLNELLSAGSSIDNVTGDVNAGNRFDGYDIVFIDSPENLYYYTGFTGGEALFVMMVHKRNSNVDKRDKGNKLCGKNMCIITDSRYYEQVEKECPDIPLVRLNNSTYIEVIKNIISGKDVSPNIDELTEGIKCIVKDVSNKQLNIAIEASMNLSRYLKLDAALDKHKLRVASDIIDKPRMVKDDNELGLLKRAEQIGDEAFDHILTILKPGITECEISLELEFFMKKQGASKLSFDTIVASGPNSSMPHAQVTDRVVQNSDFVTMDFGCVYKGYCSDMTRTVAVGTPTDEMKKVYQIVLDANLRAMDGIKAGVKCGDIDALARGYISDKGYGDYFGHGLGHSVGLQIHEEPRFSPKCDVITEENMVITDEPGIYLPGKFGVRIEDLVVVRKDGYERLSKSPKELIII